MKSPSPAQATAIYPTTLINSIHQHVSNSTGSQAFPTTTTTYISNTSSESEAVKCQRLLVIIDSAIALLDNDFDDAFNPIELCSPLQRRLQ
jgi:archaellum component FlaG (FlaF/FlaG flagellin family)